MALRGRKDQARQPSSPGVRGRKDQQGSGYGSAVKGQKGLTPARKSTTGTTKRKGMFGQQTMDRINQLPGKWGQGPVGGKQKNLSWNEAEQQWGQGPANAVAERWGQGPVGGTNADRLKIPTSAAEAAASLGMDEWTWAKTFGGMGGGAPAAVGGPSINPGVGGGGVGGPAANVGGMGPGGGPGSLGSIQDRYRDMLQTRAGVGPEQMSASQINMAPQDQFRTQQLGLTNQLMGQAMGTGPSLAEMQYRQVADRNMAGNIAAAASQRGGRAGLQNLQLQRMAGDQQRQMAMDLPMARLQEQQQMAGLVSGMAQQGRAADIGLAQTQAGFTQDAEARNAALRQQGIEARDKYDLTSMGAQTGIAEGARDLTAKQGLAYDTLKAEQALGYDKLAQSDRESRRSEAQARDKAQKDFWSSIFSSGGQGLGAAAGA